MNRVPVLRRFDAYFFKPRSPEDLAQVPVENGEVTIYSQGATVRTSTTMQQNVHTDIPVYHPGAATVSSKVRFLRYPDDPADMYVSAVSVDPNAGTGIIRATWIGLTFEIPAGARLFPVSDAGGPLFFDDPLGIGPGSPYRLTDAGGRVSAYVAEYLFDIVLLRPEETRVLIDQQGGFVMRAD